MSDGQPTARRFAMVGVAVAVAVLILVVVWRVLEIAMGVAFGMVIAVLALVGLVYLGFRSVTSGS